MMFFKNAQLHNITELIEVDIGYRMLRIPNDLKGRLSAIDKKILRFSVVE